MRVTETVETSSGPVTVRELTVGEVRLWLAGLATAPDANVDLIDASLFSDFALTDFKLFVEEPVAVDAMTGSEVRAVIDAAKRLNPDFFGLRMRLWSH